MFTIEGYVSSMSETHVLALGRSTRAHFPAFFAHLSYPCTQDYPRANMAALRSPSLVKRLNLNFSGNLSSEALLLADVDNDGSNELVIGNVDGELAVFKGTSSKPWRTCSGLGMITCVKAGDVFNTGRNWLVCTTAEGWCYVFNVSNLRIPASTTAVALQLNKY